MNLFIYFFDNPLSSFGQYMYFIENYKIYHFSHRCGSFKMRSMIKTYILRHESWGQPPPPHFIQKKYLGLQYL